MLGNPWVELPLADYEGHMALPEVGQAQLIGDRLEQVVCARSPTSVAILGCAGGNGLERMLGTSVKRVVALDINPSYVDVARERFRGRFAAMEFIVADVQDVGSVFEPVELIYAALVFEYIEPRLAFRFIHRHCRPGGWLAAVLQLPNSSMAPVTPSPYRSLRSLEPILKLVPREEFCRQATTAGFSVRKSQVARASGGKDFAVEELQRAADCAGQPS